MRSLSKEILVPPQLPQTQPSALETSPSPLAPRLSPLTAVPFDPYLDATQGFRIF